MRIPFTTIKELFRLDKSSPSGMVWRIDNPRKGSTEKKGDPVKAGQRWQRGSIPISSTYKRLAGVIDEAGREFSKPTSQPVNLSEFKPIEIISMTMRFAKLYCVDESGKLVWARNHMRAKKGDAVKVDVLRQDEYRFTKEQVIKLLSDYRKDDKFPEKSKVATVSEQEEMALKAAKYFRRKYEINEHMDLVYIETDREPVGDLFASNGYITSRDGLRAIVSGKAALSHMKYVGADEAKRLKDADSYRAYEGVRIDIQNIFAIAKAYTPGSKAYVDEVYETLCNLMPRIMKQPDSTNS